jgi:hypothetical protein
VKETYKAKIRHQYGNEMFGVRLIMKNLTHLMSLEQLSEEQKDLCRKLLLTLLDMTDKLQETFEDCLAKLPEDSGSK